MKFRRHMPILLIGILAAIIAFWLWSKYSAFATAPISHKAVIKSKSNVPTAGGAAVPGRTPQPIPVAPTGFAMVIQPPPKGATETEKLAWWREMEQTDRFFEYKMPISFYGKIVDDAGGPIGDAKIELTWVDRSKSGTSQRVTTSDGAGLFSLEGAAGKNLDVRVSKDGYRPEYSKNPFNFEYADFRLPDYYEPDSSTPVLFVLRKNRPAEPLVYRENQKAQVEPGQQRIFPIGMERTGTGPHIVVEISSNASGVEKKWSARVSVPDGGLVLTTAEFPFEAPETGYVTWFDMDMDTAKPRDWPGGEGGAFFVKTSQGYGRILVRNTLGSSWVYVTTFFNPSGSRNLEDDPEKRIETR